MSAALCRTIHHSTPLWVVGKTISLSECLRNKTRFQAHQAHQIQRMSIRILGSDTQVSQRTPSSLRASVPCKISWKRMDGMIYLLINWFGGSLEAGDKNFHNEGLGFRELHASLFLLRPTLRQEEQDRDNGANGQ